MVNTEITFRIRHDEGAESSNDYALRGYYVHDHGVCLVGGMDCGENVRESTMTRSCELLLRVDADLLRLQHDCDRRDFFTVIAYT